MTGLADCNNFFVSCERSVDRSLEGKAVVVLSNNDGCVVARSNESKQMGVKMGQPAFELRDAIMSGKLIALSGNHLLYRDISLRVHDIFRRYVPAALDYSVDEAFLDVNGIPVEALHSIGSAIYRDCWEEMHIPVTVGFAPSKTLAKIVCETAKKAGERVAVLADASDAEPLLRALPIYELWGIGRRLAKRMYESGVYTIYDFARKDLEWVKRNLHVPGERSWRELHGQPCIELDHVQRTLQDSVSESRTFPIDVDDYDYVRARVLIYASDCARKLRAMHGVCRDVGVFMRTNPFHTESARARGVRPEGIVTLPRPSADTAVIAAAALRVLNAIWVPGVAFKRAGVWLGRIQPETEGVQSLFEEPGRQETNMRKLMSAIDAINGPVGKQIGLASTIVKGHQGHNDGYSSSFQAPRR